MKKILLGILVSSFSVVGVAEKSKTHSCFSDINLKANENTKSSNSMTEARFNQIIDRVVYQYESVVTSHGAELKINRYWDDDYRNANADRTGNQWIINVFGGIAKQAGMTDDSFALLMCHELGHHLAGFPFRKNEKWSAAEGQADYFATQVCAKQIWGTELRNNAAARTSVSDFVKEQCDKVYPSEKEQNLCYRTLAAAKSLGDLYYGGGRDPGDEIAYDTPSTEIVKETYPLHVSAQCRLDSFFQGALCDVTFDKSIIPGRREGGDQESAEAEREAAFYSCTDAGLHTIGLRPRCWFKPKLGLDIEEKSIIRSEVQGNGDEIWDTNEVYSFDFAVHNNLIAPIVGAQLKIRDADELWQFSEGYQDIGFDETVSLPSPIEIQSSKACGEYLNLEATLSIGDWKKKTAMNYIMGAYKITKDQKLEIPNNSMIGVSSRITSEKKGFASEVEVFVNIEHDFIGDLRIELLGPSFKRYLVRDRQGGSADNINKSFKVQVNNEPIDGVWELQVSDHGRDDAGTLISWGLRFAPTCNN